MSASSAFNNRAPTQPGDIIAGKYRVVRELGRGGVGVVVEVEHQKLRQRLAIKLLDPFFVRDSDIVDRFEREARAMAALKSPYVTAVSDVDVLEDGTPYMVMELLEGHDMSAELRKRQVLPPLEAIDFVVQACEGLATVHAHGIVHRDLKPSNLFLVPTATGHTVKVMDFGISKFEGNEVTRTGSSLGTPAYMSPEQVRSPRDVDVRTDIWSLGVLLFRALSGALPFEGEGITGMSVAIVNEEAKRLDALRPELPYELVHLVHRCLEKDREARFATATELRDALTAVRRTMQVRSQAPTIPFVDLPVESGAEVLDSFIRNAPRAPTAATPSSASPTAAPAMAPDPAKSKKGLVVGLVVFLAALAALGAVGVMLVRVRAPEVTISPASSAEPTPPTSAPAMEPAPPATAEAPKAVEPAPSPVPSASVVPAAPVDAPAAAGPVKARPAPPAARPAAAPPAGKRPAPVKPATPASPAAPPAEMPMLL